MSLTPIERLLARMRGVRVIDAATRTAVKKAVLDHTNIELPLTAIKVRGASVFIQASSAEKAEVFMYREKILEDVREKLGDKAPKEII